MKTMIKKQGIFLLGLLVFALVFAPVANAATANYHGITVTYSASGTGHFGNLWYSSGGIATSVAVDQIGRTYWSTLEYCGSTPIQSSFWQSNATIVLPNNDHYNTGTFIDHYGGCQPGAANKLRTYFHLYVQDYPYAGTEYKPTDWETW